MKQRHFIAQFALLCGISAWADLAWAQYATEGVVYSFTEIRLGATKQYALLPVGAEPLRPDLPIQASLPTAFGILRLSKPATYGNTSVQMSDRDLAAGQVQVIIDPAVLANFEIIKAETVYTFTQLGVERVVFPGVDDDGATREDIIYAGFRMQVPLWQAVLGGAVHESDILFPDGTLVDSEDFYTRLAAKDATVTQAVLGYVGGPEYIPAFGVLTVVGTLGLPGYEGAVIPILQNDNPQLRAAALDALSKSSDATAWDAIVSSMRADADPGLRQRAAYLLGQSGNPAYQFHELVFRCREGAPEARVAALREAGTSTDERLQAEIAGIASDPDPSIRVAVTDSLFASRAWAALRGLMTTDSLPDDVRQASAQALAEGADGQDKAEGLAFRGFGVTGELALEALARLSSMTTFDSRAYVERFLAHPDGKVAVQAARDLGTRGSGESLDALKDAADTAGDDLDKAAALDDAAYEIMLKLTFPEVEEYANNRNVFFKRAAYRAFGTMAKNGQGGSTVRELLEAGLTNPNAAIRGASARALSSFGTEETLVLILGIADDSDASVRADVAAALGAFGGEAFIDRANAKLVEYVQSGEAVVVASALDSLGELKQFQLVNLVLNMVQYNDARVRASAMRAAVALADPAQPRPSINAVSAGLNDRELANRVLACQLLGEFDNELAIVALTPMVNDTTPDVRFAAIGALGASQNAGAAGTLVALVEDPEREIRTAALEALKVAGFRSTVPDLEAMLSREQDPFTAERLTDTIEFLRANGR